MRRFSSEKLIVSNWNRKFSCTVTSDASKGLQYINKPRSSYFLTHDLKKQDTFNQKLHLQTSKFNSFDKDIPEEPVFNEKLEKLKNLENFILEIGNLTERKKMVTKQSEKNFKNTVKKNLKPLDDSRILSLKEQQELIKNYSNSAKSSMFTMTKSGVKFRKNNLNKRISKRGNLK